MIRMKTARFLTLLIFATYSVAGFSSEAMPIYYASILPAKNRQQGIGGDLKKLNIDPTVFAKYSDFIEIVKTSKPNILIAPSFFGKYYPEYRPYFRLSIDGKSKIRYKLMALNHGLKGKDLSTEKIGIVQEVDRNHVNEVVSQLLGVKVKLIRTVTKPEDLLPLLVFKSADIIIVSPDNLKGLKEKFSTEVKLIQETEEIDSPTIFFRKDFDPKQLEEKIKGLSPSVLNTLGFTAVEKCEGAEK